MQNPVFCPVAAMDLLAGRQEQIFGRMTPEDRASRRYAPHHVHFFFQITR
jgi:hypothetical protein